LTARKVLLLLAGVAVLAFLVDRIVVTDAERIEDLVDEARKAVLRGDWDAVAAAVDDEVTVGERNKASLVAWWRREWQRASPASLSVDVDDVETSGDRGTARVRISPGSPYVGMWATGRLHVVKRDGGWRIAGLDDVEIRGLAR
jgi:hypothetical protein